MASRSTRLLQGSCASGGGGGRSSSRWWYPGQHLLTSSAPCSCQKALKNNAALVGSTVCSTQIGRQHHLCTLSPARPSPAHLCLQVPRCHGLEQCTGGAPHAAPHSQGQFQVSLTTWVARPAGTRRRRQDHQQAHCQVLSKQVAGCRLQAGPRATASHVAVCC